jgi:hypothetical protein
MTLSALGIFSAAGAGGAPASAYELISTTILGSSQASVSFDVSSFASTYRHLQLRFLGRTDNAAVSSYTTIRFNGDSGSNYSSHYLYGTGSSVLSGATLTTFIEAGGANGNSASSGIFSPAVLDILDAFSTTKNKTTRMLDGNPIPTSNSINLRSGSWRNTNSITSIVIGPGLGTNFVAGSRFSLYGIRG